jgi:hypothetical protein
VAVINSSSSEPSLKNGADMTISALRNDFRQRRKQIQLAGTLNVLELFFTLGADIAAL